jgi:hypothetical protein
MGNRWHGIAVVLLWLASMGWLVTEKVLPPLLIGEPPTYATIVGGERGVILPVGWRILVNGERLGWAVTTMVRQPNETTDLRSRTHFDRLPLEQFIPVWLRPMVQGGDRPWGRLVMEAESTMLIDALGRLVDFDSAIRINGQPSLCRLRGEVDGPNLKLTAHFGDRTYDGEIPLTKGAALGDSFAPQMRLPGLRLGQVWTVSSYSPMNVLSNPVAFVRSQSPLQVLHARVEDLTPIVWNGHREKVWLVVYRTEGGWGADREKTVCNRLWVRRDGAILRQEVVVGQMTVTFARMPSDEAEALIASLETTGGKGASRP